MTFQIAVEERRSLWSEINEFYIHEAWLMDERKLDDWLDLLTEDHLYFMPRRQNVLRREISREYSGPGEMNFFEESKEMMKIRVVRLQSDMAWAEDPPSRTTHLVGNLIVDPQENGEVHTKTAFIIHKTHLETDTALYSGWREDILRREEDGWKIAKRSIFINANVLLSKNISIFF